MVGAPGTVFTGACGVTGADGLLSALEDTIPLARTLKVYAVPLVRPVMELELSVGGALTVFTKVRSREDLDVERRDLGPRPAPST